MLLIALDGGTSYTGAALIHPGPGALRDAVLDMRIVLMGQDFQRPNRLHAVLRDWYNLGARQLVAEEPPPTAHKDVGHGMQALIGDRQGFVGGNGYGYWQALGDEREGAQVLDRVPPGGESSGWRESLVVMAARNGIRLDPVVAPEAAVLATRKLSGSRGKVRARRGEPGFLVPYLGCAHEVVCLTFEAVQNTPPRCPTCAAEPAPQPRDARDVWKDRAVRFVEAIAPAAFERVVSDARSRSKTVGAAPVDLAGVHDACEAAILGLHCSIHGMNGLTAAMARP